MSIDGSRLSIDGSVDSATRKVALIDTATAPETPARFLRLEAEWSP